MDNLIYKYCNIKTAKEVVNNQSVLFRHPKEYNDPFDCDSKPLDTDYKKCAKKYRNILLSKKLYDSIRSEIFSIKHKREVLRKLKKILDSFKLNYDLEEKIDYSDLRIIMDKYQKKIEPLFKDLSIKKIKDELKQRVDSSYEDLVTCCFSKVKDNILMWSHYADNHTGACFAYETQEELFEVKYDDNRKRFDIELCVILIILQDVFTEELNIKNCQKLNDYLIDFFRTKSNCWSYEKEVRIIRARSKVKDDFYTNNSNLFFRIGLPKEIYLGCRISAEDKEFFIDIGKKFNIPIFQFVTDDKLYKLVLDNKLIE